VKDREGEASATRRVLSDVDLVGCNGDGYTSVTLGDAVDDKSMEIGAMEEAGPTVQNQWVASSASSPDLVSAWVRSSLIHAEKEGAIRIGESSGKNGHARTRHNQRRAAVRQASNNGRSSSVRTLNISGMRLKAVPMMSPLSILRAVDLSGNLIGKIHCYS
jgi:hypothetical protein